MLLALAFFACTANDDTAGLDSGLPQVDTAALDSGLPQIDTAVVTTLEVAQPESAPAVDVGASCPIPALLPVAKVEHDLAAWTTRQGGLIGQGIHRMEAGETAWAIAQGLGIPGWVLREMNPGMDLDRLFVGDWLQYPVTTSNESKAWSYYTVEECGC